jgi:hypothetical protein
MECVCKPWRGYHLPECPCQAAYERIREDELADDPLSDEEADAQGVAMVKEGWVQQSRKYRRVILVPAGTSAIAELERLDPERAAAVRERAAHFLETEARQSLWHYGETRTLPLRQFEAFRKAANK